MSALLPQIITSPTLRALQRRLAGMRRRLSGRKPELVYFHQADDPYSALTARALPWLEAEWDVTVIPRLVPAPDAAAAPDAERLAAWSLRDARTLADGLGLAPSFETAPAPERVREAEAALAGISEARAFAETAAAIERAFIEGGPLPGPTGDPEQALADGARERRRLGHYLSGMIAFEGEWYWGLDRLGHLEARLAQIRPGGRSYAPRLEVSDSPPTARPGVVIEAFVSLRSPYTYIALPRLYRLAEQSGAALRLRPVLPMVMRGLPVPRNKRLYILRDVKREAERLGLPFGKAVDPVGRPVERGLAVLHAASAAGRGEAFLLSFLRGVFAQGLNAGSDAGLSRICARAGLSESTCKAALEDESWRAAVEENRAAMLAGGIWGVPAFRGLSPEAEPGPVRWGQDRLWAIEADLRNAG